MAYIKSNVTSKQILSKRTGNVFCTIICERRVVFLWFLMVQLYLYLSCFAACGTVKSCSVEQAYKQTWTLFYKQALHNRKKYGVWCWGKKRKSLSHVVDVHAMKEHIFIRQYYSRKVKLGNKIYGQFHFRNKYWQLISTWHPGKQNWCSNYQMKLQ